MVLGALCYHTIINKKTIWTPFPMSIFAGVLLSLRGFTFSGCLPALIKGSSGTKFGLCGSVLFLCCAGACVCVSLTPEAKRSIGETLYKDEGLFLLRLREGSTFRVKLPSVGSRHFSCANFKFLFERSSHLGAFFPSHSVCMP